MAIGAYILGVIAGHGGYSLIYLVGVILIVGAGLQYFALTRNTEVFHPESDSTIAAI